MTSTAPATEAFDLIVKATFAHGPCTLSCDCGDQQVWLTADTTAVDDLERVMRLIEHARYAHAGRRAIIVTPQPSILVDYSTKAATL